MSEAEHPIDNLENTSQSQMRTGEVNLTTTKMVITLLELIIAAMLIVAIALSAQAISGSLDEADWAPINSLLIAAGISALALMLARRGNTLPGRVLLPFVLATLVLFVAFTRAGLSSIAVVALPLVVIMAGLLLGTRGAFIFAGIGSIGAAVLAYIDINFNPRPPEYYPTGYEDILIIVVVLFSTAAALRVIIQRLSGSLNEAENRALELEELQIGLEQRVAARTKAIATSAEVSRSLSTILNREELVKEVVEQVQNAFGYYHAHIYLLKEDKLIMAGGTGEAGASMLASGHTVEKGRGLVGRAAENNQIVLVSDTSTEEDWLPNILLPDTKSEIAIPIAIGDLVLGVLDVQQNEKDGLDQEDVDSLSAIANQVAVAMQNVATSEISAKRAKELTTVAEISTTTAAIQDSFEMLSTMVHLTQRGFDLYHAHVFRYDEASDELRIVACGYKEGDEHKGTHGTTSIPLAQEQSLVARAARTREPVIVNDVRNEPGWLPNSELPDTRAELAVPMIVGKELLGVLDVQAENLSAFTEEDARIQMTLASQIATALQNAESFANAQRLAEREVKLSLITKNIQNASTIEEAMKIAARELGHALGGRRTIVSLDPTVLSGESSANSADKA